MPGFSDTLLALINRLERATQQDYNRLLVVLIHPREASRKERTFHEHITKELRQQNYHVLGLYEPFTKVANQNIELYLPDGHWSPAGHRVVAIKITEDLVGRKWISH